MLEGAGRAGSKKIRNKLTEIIKTPIVINRKTIFLVARYHGCLVNLSCDNFILMHVHNMVYFKTVVKWLLS
jgi:hypothetical protein